MIIKILLLSCFNICSVVIRIFLVKNQFVVSEKILRLGQDLIESIIFSLISFIKKSSQPVKLNILICLA